MREDRPNGLWIIQLIPAFEITTTDISSVPTSGKGIYRYLDNRGEVIYIGEGSIKERYYQPERREWHVSEIGYSIVNDQTERKRYESFWLDHHKKQHQHLPTYNKVSGIKVVEC